MVVLLTVGEITVKGKCFATFGGAGLFLTAPAGWTAYPGDGGPSATAADGHQLATIRAFDSGYDTGEVLLRGPSGEALAMRGTLESGDLCRAYISTTST